MAKATSKLWVFLLLTVIVVNALVVGVNGERRWQGDEEEEEGEWPPEEWGRREGSPEGRGGRERPRREEEGGGRRRWSESRRYILHESKSVVATDAGGMRVVKGVGGRFTESPMHIGLITMEPNSMFIPQYIDSSLIFFVQTGQARIGSIYKDDFVENDLKAGDLYRIQAGSAFYLVNTAQGQRLHIITSIDTSESSDWHDYEAFFIGGGRNPTSVLSGFGTQTLATAFNVSYDVIDELLSSQQEGAIVYLNPAGESGSEPSVWKRFLEQGKQQRRAQMNRIVPAQRQEDDGGEEGEKQMWSFTKLLTSILGKSEDNASDKKSLDTYNIYDRKPDFRNNYGWSIQVDKGDYKQLKKSDIGVYLVNLTAGSMMAPHVNPTAAEYGVVISGTGNVQVVYPNGTLAMDAEVNEGDVFWIPRYYPFCQVASRNSPFVFFGFTTSAHNNRPQFLAGQGSVLQAMLTPEFAAAFGLNEERLREIVYAQSESTILPSASASPGGGSEEIPGGDQGGDGRSESLTKKMGSGIRMKKSSFAYNMAVGLD